MIGVTIAKVPNPHLNPAPDKNFWAIGPPTQTVAIYGEETKANANARLLRAEVSAMKILMV